MKKAITILMAVALIFGFAGMATAQDCTTCLDPLSINRGCEVDQNECVPFDYETQYYSNNYCTPPEGKADPRVLFPVCDCEFAADLSEGDVVDVVLEIKVNGKTGNNGAYWAEDVNNNADRNDSDPFANGIGMKTYASETAACEDKEFGSVFAGDFVYYGFDNEGERAIMDPADPDAIDPCDQDEFDRPTIIQPDLDQFGNDGSHGYVIQDADETAGNSVWAVNIPAIMFDPSMINEGDEISVQICLTMADADDEDFPYSVQMGGLCTDCECCCEFTLGTILCCEAEDAQELVYPYVTPMNDANWWYGMVITNLSGTEGKAQVTVYETDGDSETITVDVEANNMFVASNVDLMDEFGADIGDARAYFEVKTDFAADGFLFIGNDGKSEAMGYLPRKPVNVNIFNNAE